MAEIRISIRIRVSLVLAFSETVGIGLRDVTSVTTYTVHGIYVHILSIVVI